jgi:nucleoside-diphosphate-sugar epimerase
MSSILVTGATGFVGLHLVEALVRRGDRLRAFIRPGGNAGGLRAMGVEVAFGELADFAALEKAATGIDVVYHVAGAVKAFSRADFFAVNATGTARVAEACAAQSVPPRLVIVSSVAAAGPAPRGKIRTEADRPEPVSYYGCSKLAGEQAAVKFAATVPITIVRPGVVFGPRDNGFIQAIRFLHAFGCHVSAGFSPPPLSCIYVTDLVELLLRAADRGRTLPTDRDDDYATGRYFASAPEYPTFADLGRMMRPMLAQPTAPIITVPGALIYLVAGFNELCGRLRGKPEAFCIDKIREALASSWACSGEAARRELGFVPAKSLAGRMQETIDWFLANECKTVESYGHALGPS